MVIHWIVSIITFSFSILFTFLLTFVIGFMRILEGSIEQKIIFIVLFTLLTININISKTIDMFDLIVFVIPFGFTISQRNH